MAPNWVFARTNSAGTTSNQATGAKSAEGNQELFIFQEGRRGCMEARNVTASPVRILLSDSALRDCGPVASASRQIEQTGIGNGTSSMPRCSDMKGARRFSRSRAGHPSA